MEKAVAIDEILTRSIDSLYPSKEKLREVLLSDKKLTFYLGADATGPTLHLGHSTNFILLEKLRKLGHSIIVLFGDFTAQIGDPSGKEAVRVTLSVGQVNENLATWEKQVSKLIDFSDTTNPPRILRNSEWLAKLTFSDLIGVASNFTVQQMIERDMFQERLKNEKPIYLHEFFYPLMQGYDSVMMDVDGEIGGNDQTFNMLAGRTLLRKMKDKEKFVIATTLLINPKTGKKLMSKSEGQFIGMDDSPQDMYGKTMALNDEAVFPMFTHCTKLSLEEIDTLQQEVVAGTVNPKEIKMKLAHTLVSMYHSAKDADSAEQWFASAFSKKEVPDDIPTIKASKGELLLDVLLSGNYVPSKAQGRRLVLEGAISDLDTKEKISDPAEQVSSSRKLKIGKHQFVSIEVN